MSTVTGVGARGLRVIAVGACMVELRHLDERTLALGFGGDTCNTAVYLARELGAQGRVAYATAVGDDPYSAALRAFLAEHGLDTSLVRTLERHHAGLYLIRTAPDGERTFTYYRSAAAARRLFEGAPADYRRALATCDLLYLSGITLSILDDAGLAALGTVLAAARATGARVAFDGNWRPAGWSDPGAARAAVTAVLPHVDVALPTLEDERDLWGDADASTCVARHRAAGVDEVVVKRGPAGATVTGPEGLVDVPAAPVPDVVDTTAAGDAFNAAYLAARSLGADPVTAAVRGNRLAGEVIRAPGAIVPTALARVAAPAR